VCVCVCSCVCVCVCVCVCLCVCWCVCVCVCVCACVFAWFVLCVCVLGASRVKTPLPLGASFCIPVAPPPSLFLGFTIHGLPALIIVGVFLCDYVILCLPLKDAFAKICCIPLPGGQALTTMQIYVFIIDNIIYTLICYVCSYTRS